MQPRMDIQNTGPKSINDEIVNGIMSKKHFIASFGLKMSNIAKKQHI